MKIHMDYLEGKIEQLVAQNEGHQDLIESLSMKVETYQDKIKLIKEQKEFKEREMREQSKKLSEVNDKKKGLDLRIKELERQLNDDRNFYANKLMAYQSSSKTPD